MDKPSRAASPSRDPLTLLSLAAGLAMGQVVAAMAEHATTPGPALAAALVFVVAASAAVVCALAAVPRSRWTAPQPTRWITAIGLGLLGALAPMLLS